MPDDSLLAGRTVAPSKPDNGAGRNSSGLSTDSVKIYKVCEYTIPSTFWHRCETTYAWRSGFAPY
jgi:hypothetical protein